MFLNTTQQNPLLQATNPNQNLIDALMQRQTQGQSQSLVPQTPIQPVGEPKESWLRKIPGLNGAIPGIGPLDLLGL